MLSAANRICDDSAHSGVTGTRTIKGIAPPTFVTPSSLQRSEQVGRKRCGMRRYLKKN